MKRATIPKNSLARPLARLASAEGANSTRHPGVTVYRVTESQPPTPTLYSASVIIVAQGKKRGYLGENIYEYDAGNYLLMTSPMPMLCEIVAVAGLPVLTLAVEIDIAMLGDLILELGDDSAPKQVQEDGGVLVSRLTPTIEEVAVRLLNSLDDPISARVLARQQIRELLFHVLRGPMGEALRALALPRGRAGRLSRVLRHMNANFTQPLRVDQLAQLANMSVATFHENFRALTTTSPLQYLKSVRLTKARRLMVQEGLTAGVAAQRVGYASDSQFSREFRRFFGLPPATGAAQLRSAAARLTGRHSANKHN